MLTNDVLSIRAACISRTRTRQPNWQRRRNLRHLTVSNPITGTHSKPSRLPRARAQARAPKTMIRTSSHPTRTCNGVASLKPTWAGSELSSEEKSIVSNRVPIHGTLTRPNMSNSKPTSSSKVLAVNLILSGQSSVLSSD